MNAALPFTLQQPAWLWLLLPLLLLHALLARRRRPVPFAAAGELGATAGERLPRSWRVRLALAPALLQALALAAAAVALAEPVVLQPAPPVPPGRDLVLCVDRSSSMAATDLAPDRTRLAVGLDLLGEFVRTRADDRIGLVTFARYADLRCPPTGDHGALLQLLQRTTMVAKDGPEDATAIGAAAALAASLLRRSAAPARVAIVVTDGEENVATAGSSKAIAPLHAAQLCASSGIRVHTIVVGRGSARADGTFAPLDTTAVEQLAATTGGRSFRAENAAALASVCAAIDELEAAAFQAPGVVAERWHGAAMLLALSLFATAFGVSATWLRRLA